jgi:ABC-type sugar transport system ATPase subunit
MAGVELERVTKIFPKQATAAVDVSLNVEGGELLTLVGPSGCGKTTTLRLIAGLEPVTSGVVRVGGRDVTQLGPRERDVAMVFQNYALYPHMSVYQNLAFGLRMRGVGRAEIDRRVQEAAERLRVMELLRRYPGTLSGGQQQRVALGRAIVRRPTCFLLDEPLSNLDPQLRLTTRAEIKRLQRELRVATVYVTHDPEEAMSLGDRIAVFDRGRIVQHDRPLEVYRRPLNRFVATFFGVAPMNFLEGEVVSEGGAWFVGGGVRVRLPAEAAGRAAARGLRRVVLGFRPEAAAFPGHAAGQAGAEGSRLDLLVTALQPTGEQVTAHCLTASGCPLILRAPGLAAAEGERIAVELPAASVHLFEPGEHGRSLTASAGATGKPEGEPCA